MTSRPVRTMSAVMVALAAVWLVVLPPVPSDAESQATVKIRATFADGSGARQNLAGVEVWILENYGRQRFACTNAKGVATFDEVEPGVLHTAGMGPSFNMPRCDNAEFVDPVGGLHMFSVVYKNHRGVLPLDGVVDGFFPVGGATTTIRLKARPLKKQAAVCGGLRTTWTGTKGADVFPGTPGNDVVNALGGNDVLYGGGGVDYLCGGNGNDVINGGKDGDVLLGQGGNKDNLIGKGGFDILDGGTGNLDRCRGELLFDCER